ncbi:MAG: hypothetical protein COT17_05135 [Elusimicrobia bacterium CG08_land_8_20_14_0_20_51_18]|nr:MAG: hypothetical protein COT17_05135 [Elusimicrobia bacterium CG08_land_8_20_14_0_20_51_18]
MKNTFDIVLLTALPASGKSEVRKFLTNVPSDKLMKDFHIGRNLQLDDFPYVHIMRRIDDELSALGKNRLFFQSGDKPFINPGDWGTLIHIINEDYRDLINSRKEDVKSAGEWMMNKIERAAQKAKIEPRLGKLDRETFSKVAGKLEKESRDILNEKYAGYTDSFEGKTIVIEFARGGAHGSSMPLKEPFGYQYSFGQLDEEILKKAVILYIWVTPEESRRKNNARANPDDPGSILHHGVPIDVMMNDYGCDDMQWLYDNSRVKDTITVGKYHVPFARFDNRVDRTSFLREDAAKWDAEKVKAVSDGIKSATDRLYSIFAGSQK